MKTPSVSRLKKVADKVFSEYIRQRDDGRCFTCGKHTEWRYQQNGHFVPRSYNSLRYDERNNNCQCPACNIWKHGAMDEYALALTKKYGTEILQELATKKREVKQFTVKELQDIIATYREKLLIPKL